MSSKQPEKVCNSFGVREPFKQCNSKRVRSQNEGATVNTYGSQLMYYR